MTLRGFLIEEQKLYQLIEMCMTVGLEPHEFDLFEAACDAETIGRWTNEEWLDESTATELREIFLHGLTVLANDWRLNSNQTFNVSNVQMRRKNADDGTTEACVLDLKPAVQADLLTLLDHIAIEDPIDLTLSADDRQLLEDVFLQHTLFPSTRVPSARRLGPAGDGVGFSFMLPIEIFAHSFHAIPKLASHSKFARITNALIQANDQRLAWVAGFAR